MKTIFTTISFSLFSLILSAQSPLTTGLNKYNTIYENTNLSNGLGDYFFTGRSAGTVSNRINRGLLQFDISSIPAGSTITGVSLVFNMSVTISGATNVSLHKITSDWGQGTSDAAGQEGGGAASTAGDASWSCSFHDGATGCTTSWTSSGGDFTASASATTSVNGTGNYTWSSATMMSDLQDWLDNGSNFGWIMVGDESTGGTAKRFDVATASLEVTYDEPLGVNDNAFYKAITTFPNPTNDNTTIQLGTTFGSIEATVFNTLGQEISSATTLDADAVTVTLGEDLGIYFVKVQTESGETATLRVVKN